MTKTVGFCLSVLCICFLNTAYNQPADDSGKTVDKKKMAFVTIGTGGITGVYYRQVVLLPKW